MRRSRALMVKGMRRGRAHGCSVRRALRGSADLPLARLVLAFAFGAVVALCASPTYGQDEDRTGGSAAMTAGESGGGFLRRLAGRLSVHLGGSYQVASRAFETQTGFAVYGEEARFSTRQEFSGGSHVDVGGTARIWRQLAIGASYTDVSNAGTAVVTGTVPHPLDFDRDRSVSAQAVALSHRQRATHVYAAWRLGLYRSLDVTVFAGPTYFNLVQGVITDLTVKEMDGRTFQQVAVQARTGEGVLNGLGFNVGADVTWMVTRWLGVGYTARATAGSVDAPASSISAPVHSVGGFQTGIGLRLRL